MNTKNNKIVLGISGGVDSTTAALLLLEKGYDVYGMYFNIHEGDAGERSEAEKALKEAYAAYARKFAGSACDCDCGSEKFIYLDASEAFRDIVISDFCREYRLGRTPNPCIVCNPNIKFRLLCETADKVGAYYIATGHYADTAFVTGGADNRTSDLSANDDEACRASGGSCGTYYIKAAGSKKDQSYMLYRLPQDVIKRLVLPLSAFSEKEDVRDIARENSLSAAEKSDSQEICFIENGTDHAEFIKAFCEKSENTSCVSGLCGICGSDCASGTNGTEEGDFVDKNGKVLGRHKGIVNYTIGQRKGLGIALGHPVFITDIDSEKNTVTLGENEELMRSSVEVCDLFFTETGGAALPDGIHKKNLTAKVRYAAPRAAVKIASENMTCGSGENDSTNSDVAGCSEHTLKLIFETPQRAMTPGQSLVLYDGDLVIGGGIIKKAL